MNASKCTTVNASNVTTVMSASRFELQLRSVLWAAIEDPGYVNAYAPALNWTPVRVFYVIKWMVFELGFGFLHLLNLWVSLKHLCDAHACIGKV